MRKIVFPLLLVLVVLLAGVLSANVEVVLGEMQEWGNGESPEYISIVGIQFHMAVVVYGLTLGISVVVLLWWVARKEMKLHWVSFALLMCAGTMIALGKWPQANVGWDEDTHRMWAYLFSGWDEYDIRVYFNMFNTWFFGYVPYTLGMALGKLIGLAENDALRLSFVAGVLVYSLICAYAVKVTPKYKLTFMTVSLLPTCLFQAAAITYDAVVVACILLGVAILIRELEQQETLLSSKAALGMTMALTLGTLAKPAYSPVLLLLWLLPAKKFASKGRKWLFRLVVTVLLVMCLCSMLLGMYDEQMAGDSRMADTDSAGQLEFILNQPGKFASMLGNYILHVLPRLMVESSSAWAHLGANQMTSWLLMILLWIICPICCVEESKSSSLTAQRRVMLVIVGLLPVFALMIAQYLVSTPVGHHTIEGMQGRYVLPTLICLSLAIMPPEKWREHLKKGSRWVALAVSIALVAVIYLDGWTYIISSMQGVTGI